MDWVALNVPLTRSAQLFQEAVQAEAAGNYLLALGKYSDSLEPGGNHNQTWARIGSIFIRIGQWQQAIDTFEFILQLEPDNGEAYHGLAMAYQQMGQSEQACVQIDKALQLRPDSSSTTLLHACIHAGADTDPAKTFSLFSNWGKRFADPLISKSTPLKPDRSPDRQLKVGYISGDMREHSIAFFLAPVFANHNKESFSVSVFSTGAQKDDMTTHLKSLVPNWFNVAGLNDDALFTLIRKQKIDVLVDLSGHTEGQRLNVFARRAAPVQVTWLGFMFTLGLQAMDYRLTDFLMDPPGNESWYVEKLFRLNCMASYSPPPDAEIAEDPPMLTNGGPMLVSLNHSRKLTDEMLLMWRQVMLLRPDCTLLLHVNELTVEAAIAGMQPRLEKLAFPLDRILISPHVPLQEFMQRGHIADIALDTTPLSGGTTTLHALWMGLPVVAFESDIAVSSATANTLKSLGLDDWIAYDEASYIQKVLALMDDTEALKAHRATVRQKMQTGVLMDYTARCKELESAYRMMWFNYLLDEPRYLHAYHDLDHELAEVNRLLSDKLAAKHHNKNMPFES